MKKIRFRKWVKFIFTIILLTTSFYLYSRYIGTKGLIVKEYSIVDSNIQENFYGFKIVHISDIHFQVTTDINDIKNIVKKVNLLKPDIVIFSGDLLDNSIKYNEEDIKKLSKELKKINCTINKYIIKGENDTSKYWSDIVTDSNFIDLDDSYDLIYMNGTEPILLVGISSNYKKVHINKTLKNIYKEINSDYKYSILIMHEPDIIDKIDYSKFNLILAGHSLNGSIVIPFIDNVISYKYSKKYYDNYYELDNTKLYISSGIGTHKYKLRFLNKPSINLYRLRNK